MFVSSAYIALILLALLIPLLIPKRPKSRALKRLKVMLSVGILVSTLNALTPDRAVKGAPFKLLGEDKRAELACGYSIYTTANFCPKDVPSSRCFCENPNALATIAHCYEIAYKSQIDTFLRTCKEDYNIDISRKVFKEVHENYTKYAKYLDEDYDFSYLVDFPVKMDDKDLESMKRAYDQFLGNYERSVYYGFYIVGFWAVVFCLAAIGNWSKILFPNIQRRMTGTFTNWFRSRITLPATMGKSKTNEKIVTRYFEMLVPTRAESLILVAFSIICLYLAQYRIHYEKDDPIFLSRKRALLRYSAVRSGILLSHLMPLMILFGGRNNFLQWITRWDYSTFITLHRWVSRMIMILLTIHAGAYCLYMRSFKVEIMQPYLLWGSAAAIAGVAIMIQGLLVLRRKWYELFLLLHIVLALVFIVGSYLHVYHLEWVWFYYISSAIWVFDRIVRISRLISFGFPKAEVFLLADETLKVVVPTPEYWEPIPGGHVFIHFLRPSCFWQSHPFTYTVDVKSVNNIILYIKVKEGVTSSLYQNLSCCTAKSTHIRVAIEGSYGESTPAARYDNRAFIAGGNGIPGIYAEAYDLARRHSDSSKKIKLIWIVREFKSLYWFYEELRSLANTNIETEIYVTKPESYSCLEEFDLRTPQLSESSKDFDSPTFHSDESTPLISSSHELSYVGSSDRLRKEETIARIKSELSYIVFKTGRPVMEKIVKQCIKESTGSACFVTCGHPVMVDELRASVVSNINNEEHKRADYFEQLQVWA